MHFNMKDHIIFNCIGGSHLYGTNVEGSDIDYRSVVLPPIEIEWGISYTYETSQEHGTEEDNESYSLGKFMKLAMDCNPNVLELLYVPENKIKKCSKEFRLLTDNRDLFLTKRAEHRFCGYAISQLKRIKLHRAYLLSPPDHKPTREEFGLSEGGTQYDSSMVNAIIALGDEQLASLGFKDETHNYFMREKQYRRAKQVWDKYTNWYETRNKSRYELESKYGLDTKHAMHLIRLLQTTYEIPLLKTLRVDRTGIDNEFLKDIRNGLYKYEQIIEMVEEIEKLVHLDFDLCDLPKCPDIEKINNLYISICLQKFGYGMRIN